jgi:hypothetical protein
MVLTAAEQTQWTTAVSDVNTLITNVGTYNQNTTTNAGVIQNIREMKAQLSSLVAQKAQLDQAESTFEQEFQERLDAGEGPGSGRLQRLGITTFQDIVLALFFSSIGLMILSLIIYGLLYSTKKVTATVSFLAIGGVIVALLMSILIRFG